SHPARDVQIAGYSAVPPGVTFGRYAQARSRLCTRWYSHFHRVLLGQSSVAMTRGANIPQSALAVAARACQAELHRTGHLSNVAGAVAFRANRRRATQRAAAAASFTSFLADNIEPNLSAANGLPEIDVQTV